MKQAFATSPSSDGRQFDFYVPTLAREPGLVHKRIFFDEPLYGFTNMALVDVLADNELSDSTRSGHGHTELIFATVATVLHTFLMTYPTETVYFQGSDPKGTGRIGSRQRLYNRVLSKPDNYQLAINYFRILGVYGSNILPYYPNSAAEAFLIKSKN